MAYGTVNVDSVVNSDGTVTGGLYGFKNRIINGAMMIDQRNSGASVTYSSSTNSYNLDRWRAWSNGSGGSAAFTLQRSSTSPAGFTNSVAITQTASYSPSGSNYNLFAQYIEGYNVADLGWGAAGAATVTLSFWVRSSLTGTFGGVVSNAAQDRSYPFTYTISSANTWEQKTITIAGDTTGTWRKDDGAGILIFWQLGVGSSYLGAAGAWAGATYLGATGATQITATNGATFYITGVQLEKGSTATSFDYRPYGTELALCQRYYARMVSDATYTALGSGLFYSTTAGYLYIKYPTTMRASPTLSYSALALNEVAAGYSITSAGSGYLGKDSCLQAFNIASGGTAYRPIMLTSDNTTSGYVAFSAEL